MAYFFLLLIILKCFYNFSEDSLQRGIAVLVLLDETGEHDQRIWELLDTSLLLLGARVPAQIVLTWEPKGDENNAQPSWRNEQPALLPCSRIQVTIY